jgi:6-pyruvoyl-tetrahydropterin synthase
MKKLVILFLTFSVFVSCQKNVVEKPDDLIEEDVMVDIIYDLSLLEAIKSQNPASLEVNNINPNDYIYKKYKIDSLLFAQSNQYYATDIKNYKNIYDKVTKKLEEKMGVADTAKTSKSNSDEQIVR